MPNYLSPGVYIEEVQAASRPIEGVGTAVAAFVGLAQRGPANTPVMVTNWSQFVATFGDFMEGSYLAHSVYGFFLNGGTTAYIVRIGADGADAPTARLELPSSTDASQPAFRVVAVEAVGASNDINVEVTEPSEPGEGVFRLVVTRGSEQEVYDNVSLKRGKQNVFTAVKASKLVRLEEVAKGDVAPAVGAKGALTGGTSSGPIRVSPDEYVGNVADRTGFGGLEAVEEITMVAAPDLMALYQAGVIDMDGLKAVQLAIIAHCELMGDRVAILDAPPDYNAQQVKEWRQDKAGYDSKYATLYWPWVKVFDPIAGQPVFVPPSGHLAGIWARSDGERGVHKAPANEIVRGAIALELNITRAEHDQLNPVGINCIRSFPGQGIRVWGARTLSSDPEWRYLNVRRLFNFVEESILSGTNWVVFEPNDPKLWDSVKRTVTMFLRRVWRDGALFGRTPNEAFFVKCDEENNPPENRDVGILTVEIGIAPVKPAEFVVFRISQFSGGAGLEE
jgi:phage tail sheath protein FI